MVHDKRPAARVVQHKERIVAARDREVAEHQVDVGVQRGRQVRAEAPHGIERDQCALDLAPARVRLSVSDRDPRRTGETGVLLVPAAADRARVDVDFDGREAAGRHAQRRRRRRLLRPQRQCENGCERCPNKNVPHHRFLLSVVG